MKLEDLYLGISCEDCEKLAVEGNVFSFIGTDAMDIPGARGATIADNIFRDFRPVPNAHPDAIQCWTTRKASGCKDVTIFRNTFQGDPGHEFQGVYFGDEAGVGGYDRITVSHNTFVCTMWHAVNIGAGVGIQILNNKITAGPNYKPWFRTATPVSISGNTGPSYFVQNKQGLPAGNAAGGLFKK